MVTRLQILSKTTTFNILNYFLKPYHNKSTLKRGDNIRNPLISHKQETPSFNIYNSTKGDREWRYKDFTGMDGSAFDLVMNLFSVNFSESLSIINKEMGLGFSSESKPYENKPYKYTFLKKPEPEYYADRNYEFKVNRVPFNNFNRTFWAQSGIAKKGLNKFHVNCLSSFSAYNKENKYYSFNAFPNNPIFEYEHEGWSKIYMPYSKLRFLTIGKKPNNYLFGLEQLPKTGESIFLTGGEKDVLSLDAHNHSGVCMNSEESNPVNYKELIEILYGDRFKNKYLLYDNDKTGISRMLELITQYPMLEPLILPQMIEKNKDITDWYKLKYRKNMF